jgi:hypothetical protein
MRKGALPLMIGVSTMLATALICVHRDYMRHWEFGVFTFVLGYPAWLLGCLLACRGGPKNTRVANERIHLVLETGRVDLRRARHDIGLSLAD